MPRTGGVAAIFLKKPRKSGAFPLGEKSNHDPADAGKMAHYMLRWRFRDGSVSAFGETESATITG